jgi:transcriptional regulator with XRE-family HTH domain
MDNGDDGTKALVRQAFGEQLRRMLEELRWSQAELARRMGVHRNLIRGFLQGRATPNALEARQLRRVLQIGAGESEWLDKVVAVTATYAERWVVRASSKKGRFILEASARLAMDRAQRLATLASSPGIGVIEPLALVQTLGNPQLANVDAVLEISFEDVELAMEIRRSEIGESC